ncbi:nuclease HARBI1-like protein [Aphelenchoides avenae]|nr:nuclease HARBI1-like protein [Aphelenchus avenae]
MPLLRRDPVKFRNYFRMSEATFDLLMALTEASPEERLAVTLSFLASGTPYRRLAYSFRISNQAISAIVAETCAVIYDVLKDKYLAMPQIPQEWKAIADGFWARWNISNTLGAIDGKHIQIKKPANSGSAYFNYKGSFSLVLMAMCDYRYRIVWAEFGNYGSDSDGRVFDRCAFRSGLDEGTLGIPGAAELPGTDMAMNYFCVADAAFPLTTHIMKPLPGNNLTEAQRIYNYRISRARRVIENVFGIMACKWRVLLKPIETSAVTADAITKAICPLHNFVIDEDKIHTPTAQADTGLENEDNGRWRREIDPLSSANVRARGGRATLDAQNMRQDLVAFFNGPGAVRWQNQYS